MCNQLKVEFFKLRHFWIFYIVAACMAGIGFSYGCIKLASLDWSIYNAFAETNCDTSFMFILSFVSAWFIGSDFSNRTIHHEILIGYSRWAILAVRELSVYLSAIILHATYVIFTMLGIGFKKGFSGNLFTTQDLFWCATILLQLIALQSIVVFIAFIWKKAPAAIATSICFTFILCNIIRNYYDGDTYTKSCFYLARSNENRVLVPTSIAAVVTLIVTILLTYLVFRRRNID